MVWSDTIPYSYQIPKQALITGWLMGLELDGISNWLVLSVSLTDPCLDPMNVTCAALYHYAMPNTVRSSLYGVHHSTLLPLTTSTGPFKPDSMTREKG